MIYVIYISNLSGYLLTKNCLNEVEQFLTDIFD